uniref:Uncharacterized protein n=1 Tax=Arundo donax TaxID=35708 RepID=A0A0A9HR08_ARUDO
MSFGHLLIERLQSRGKSPSLVPTQNCKSYISHRVSTISDGNLGDCISSVVKGLQLCPKLFIAFILCMKRYFRDGRSLKYGSSIQSWQLSSVIEIRLQRERSCIQTGNKLPA